MRTFIRKTSHRPDDENPYWISFSDLMSALLVVFLLTAIALIIELSEKKDLIDQEISRLMLAQEARDQILEEVEEELQNLGIKVQIAENRTILRIPSETLEFESNVDEMTLDQQKRNRVKIIGEVFHRVLNSELETDIPHVGQTRKRDYLDTIFIEGHTDSEPAPKWPNGNWGLSAARGIFLWKFWEDSTSVSPRFSALENPSGEKLFSVSGYADTRRLVSDDSDAKAKSMNRRIDIRITIMRPTIQDLQKVIDK